MVLGLGSDIIEIGRIEASIQRHGNRFLDRLFTQAEQSYCQGHRDSHRHFAGRFAAKEAIVKAFGTGIREGVNWTDIEILNDTEGKPHVVFSDRMNEKFNNPQVQLSISHCKEYAMAVALWVS